MLFLNFSLSYVLYGLYYASQKKKSGDCSRFPLRLKHLSLSVSRVLSCTVIYLGLSSPISSSDIHGIPPDGQPHMADTQSCSEWGLHGIPRYRGIGELLPRLSILTGKTLRFISVALSLKSPSPDVIRHPVLCCSDFPHRL